MDKTEALKQIDAFESHYRYDATFAKELLEHSPEGFIKYNNFIPLTAHREKLTVEEFWVAKLASMQIEDCGDCLQLNVRMALEEGVSKDIVESAIKGGGWLSDHLKDLYNYSRSVAAHEEIDPALLSRIETRYDIGALLELGLGIASAKFFPTLKRAVGYTRSCSLVEIEV